MRKLLTLLVAACAAGTAGCWRTIGESYLDPDFPNQGITTIAVLPVLNKTEQPIATPSVLASLVRQLSREKKFNVLPVSKTMARLRSGGGGAAYVQLMNQVSLGQEPSEELYDRMARGLEADALFQETIVAFHFLKEDVVGATSSGDARYQQVSSTVVEVKGMLWGVRAHGVVWKDHAEQHYYHDPTTEGEGSAGPVVDLATHDLLAHFPENSWSPRNPPAPTPIPSPVTSYVPFKTPSDPNAPQ